MSSRFFKFLINLGTVTLRLWDAHSYGTNSFLRPIEILFIDFSMFSNKFSNFYCTTNSLIHIQTQILLKYFKKVPFLQLFL